MVRKRQLHLGAFMRPATIHTGGWRYPNSYADANFNFEHIILPNALIVTYFNTLLFRTPLF